MKKSGSTGFTLLLFFGKIEGPLHKKSKASYLVAYRYSTLKIFQTLGIQIGTSAVPNYQDLTVKLNFPTKKSGYVFHIWAERKKSD